MDALACVCVSRSENIKGKSTLAMCTWEYNIKSNCNKLTLFAEYELNVFVILHLESGGSP